MAQKKVLAASAPSLLARKQELVREAISSAAIDLFAEAGFDETTVEQIAEHAGVSPRTFFRYFSSKHDLLAQGVVPLGQALSELIAHYPASMTATEAMREAVLVVSRGAAVYPKTQKILRIAQKYPAARQAQLSRIAEVQDEVARAFAKRSKPAKGNEFRPALLGMMTVMLFHLSLQTWFEGGQGDMDAAVDKVFGTARDLFAHVS